jgi:hypothetical protein
MENFTSDKTKKELSPESVEKTMEKVIDIDTKGTAYSSTDRFQIPEQEKTLSLQSEEKQNIDSILAHTVYDARLKELRKNKFEEVWSEGWKESPGKGEYFGVPHDESPFEKYSSKGWKIHIAFKKGFEKEVAAFLYENGLYFKIEGGLGTYFNGKNESGSTIYVGSRDNVEKIAELIQRNFSSCLMEGVVATLGERKFPLGSGADEELAPKIMARFDVAKTEHGWADGDGKYAEKGLPSWAGLGGIPILSKYDKEVSDLVRNWKSYTESQRKVFLQKVYGESRRELVKDFGQEFLLGEKDKTQFK